MIDGNSLSQSTFTFSKTGFSNKLRKVPLNRVLQQAFYENNEKSVVYIWASQDFKTFFYKSLFLDQILFY